MNISERQRRLVRHALGLDRSRRVTYRNRWITHPHSEDRDVWMDLLEQGLVSKKPWGHAGVEIFSVKRPLAMAVLEEREHLDREFAE